MKYQNTNRDVRVGDRVRYAGTPGVVVFIVDDDAYSPTYSKKDWSYLEGGIGIEVQFDSPTLIHLDSSENQEDLTPVDRD